MALMTQPKIPFSGEDSQPQTLVTKKYIQIKSPPLNDKVKRTDENYNDFYNNNITFYMEHMKEHYSYSLTNTSTTATAAAPPTLPASLLT
ncbi:hypothetical protein J6590_102944 [Homalodisca vitripennis]|nr:hypothetical protein J6590_102944 [Homalodisca vitripennis]